MATTKKKTRPTITDIAKYCEGKNRTEIAEYFSTNKIFDTVYVPHEEVMAACSLVVRDACYKDNKFYVDSDAVNILSTVYSMMLHSHIECSDMTFEEVFDVIEKYHVASIFEEENPGYKFDVVIDAVQTKIADLKHNEYSIEVLLSALADALTTSLSQLSAEVERDPSFIQKYINK